MLSGRRLTCTARFFRSSQVQTTRKYLHADRTNANGLPYNCQRCSAPLPTRLPACPKCWHISTLPMSVPYHTIFGLPYDPSPFSVDVSLLRQKFRTAQGVCHPDAWASQGDDKRRVAEDLSARINEAYQTLLQPLSRVEYILKLHGHELTDVDEMGVTDVSEKELGFLNTIMETRMEIEEADPEVLEDIRTVEKIDQQNQDKIRDTVMALDGLLSTMNEWPSSSSKSPNWTIVRRAAIHLRYLESIQSAVKDWLDRVEMAI